VKTEEAILSLLGSDPSLTRMCAMLDYIWDSMECNFQDSQKLAEYYSHPIWTINGFFTETHKDSVLNREAFTKYILSKSPKRIADYGGGFAALSRMIAKASPDIKIEIIEPYPSPKGVELCSEYPNISYVDKMSEKYDFIIAVDVLEHLEKPFTLIEELSNYIEKEKGRLFLANCFYPVIKCHHPATFHLANSFHVLMGKMGFKRLEKVLYAEVFVKKRDKIQYSRKIKRYELLSEIRFEASNIIKNTKSVLLKILGLLTLIDLFSKPFCLM
jgi:hypothetical protein